MMSKLVAIAIKPKHRAEMELVKRAVVTIEKGIEGDCCGVGGLTHKRQVTILSRVQWEDACGELGVELPWTTRRANLLVDGTTFGPANLGKTLVFGVGFEEVRLVVMGETKPCSRMDEAHRGLKAALSKDWRGGVICRVMKGGVLRIK